MILCSQIKLDSADVIVLRFGENVRDVDNYEKNLAEFVQNIQLKSKAPIAITGCFWNNPYKDACARSVAARFNLPYISLYHLDIDSNKALAGGVATDTLGNEYHFEPGFIGAHPNDAGMKAIADAILPLFINN